MYISFAARTRCHCSHGKPQLWGQVPLQPVASYVHYGSPAALEPSSGHWWQITWVTWQIHGSLDSGAVAAGLDFAISQNHQDIVPEPRNTMILVLNPLCHWSDLCLDCFLLLLPFLSFTFQLQPETSAQHVLDFNGQHPHSTPNVRNADHQSRQNPQRHPGLHFWLEVRRMQLLLLRSKGDKRFRANLQETHRFTIFHRSYLWPRLSLRTSCREAARWSSNSLAVRTACASRSKWIKLDQICSLEFQLALGFAFCSYNSAGPRLWIYNLQTRTPKIDYSMQDHPQKSDPTKCIGVWKYILWIKKTVPNDIIKNHHAFCRGRFLLCNHQSWFLDMQFVAKTHSFPILSPGSHFFHNASLPLFVLVLQAPVKLENTNEQWVPLLFSLLDDAFVHT